MSEANFSIHSYNQTVSVTENEISGDHDSLHAYLRLPINFLLRSPRLNEIGFDLLPSRFRLFFADPYQFLSENHDLRGVVVERSEVPKGYLTTFILNEAELNFIEKTRTGDLRMVLEIAVQAMVKNAVSINENPYFLNSHIQEETVRLPFIIPKSLWVEKILPQTGFRNLKLIEIPLSHSYLKEAYADIIKEFDRAAHYFNQHDYNKCVAHCRHTLDALTRNLKSIKNESKSQTGFEWLQKTGSETFAWIDKLNQSSSAITSKAHHAGQSTDFERYEAESIYLVILGLVNYIGHLKRHQV